MRREALAWIIGLTIVTAGGCVTKGKYDAVVDELNTIRKDLHIAQVDELVLTQQATSLELVNRKVQTDAEAASAALQQAKAEAESERRAAEGRLATLQRTLSQFVGQLRTLRQKLEDAKEDTVALKEVIAVYKEKRGPLSETGATAVASQVAPTPEPASPTLAAPPQTEPAPAATVAQPTLPVSLLPDKPPPQNAQPAEPPEKSLLSAIMEWLISLWRSIFS
jgi:hypothetical protein